MYFAGFGMFLILSASDCENARLPLVTPGRPDRFAASFGYHAQSVEVTTADGYILTSFRIRNTSAILKNQNPEPFILAHGMGSNAGQWVVLGPKNSLAFILADHGFDVWLCNARGSLHSRKHSTFSPDSPEFWDYSWHEIGFFDMPALVDQVLNTTGYKQVWYTGHSMGTTIFFVMTSARPEYNKKVKHMFGFAPSGYQSHSRLSSMVAPHSITFVERMGPLYKNRFNSDIISLRLWKFGLCKIILQQECAQPTMGSTPGVITDITENAFTYFPDDVSMRQMCHYGQLFNHPFTFRMYDFREMNEAKYKSREPPKYPLERISTPMTLFYSNNDNLVSPKDVEKFSKEVQNARLFFISTPYFSHFDFASMNAKKVVYDPMFKMIADIRNNSL